MMNNELWDGVNLVINSLFSGDVMNYYFSKSAICEHNKIIKRGSGTPRWRDFLQTMWPGPTESWKDIS